jgi:predicted ATPase/DNA-binding SARP family transcriptional activator
MIFLQLFGTFLARDNDRPITTFRSSRARALLAYLAVESHTPLWRDKIAALLWSDMPDGRARRNLSVTLTRLQDALNFYTPGVAGHLINSTTQTLHLRPETELWCDALELAQHLTAVASHSHPHIHTCDSCLVSLATAVQLYQSEFLAGFSVEDAPLFEEWLTLTREGYHQQVLAALNTLTESALDRQAYAEACQYAQQQLVLEPWLEHAHYQYMQALVQKGERGKALHQFELCRTRLATEFGVAPGAEITALYKQLQSLASTSDAGIPRRSTPPAVPGLYTLLRTPNRFFGREQEQSDLETLLGAAGTRLVTVLGNGGMGKTRLATEVGYAMHDHFPDGVWFVSLVGVEADSPGAVRTALVRALTETLSIIPRPNMSPEAVLIATLRSQVLLLILDNMEHLLEGAPFISDLLRAAPHLTVLCTSRAPLKLQAEWLFPLGGLPVPQGNNPPDKTGAKFEESIALQLFVARARQVVPTFALTDENGASLIAICVGTHGSPLGIELAAAMMRYRSPQMLATALQQSLDAIYSEQRDVEARHRSLRAIFTSSWQLLRAEEQSILSQLSLFRAPFSAESAFAVAGATPAHLDALIDHSLLTAVGHTHYELHVLVRDYAAERLAATETYEAAHTRYRHYFLGLLSEHYPALLGMEPRSAMESLHEGIEEIRTAWNSAIARGEVATLARALPPLTRYMLMSDRIGGVGIAFEQDALRLTDTSGDDDQAMLALIGALWVAAAQTTLIHAPLETLISVGKKICALAQRIASPVLEAHGWRVKGIAHLLKGSSEQAPLYLDRALTLARRTDDVQLLLLCLAAYRTPLETQRAAAEEALALATAMGDGWVITQLQTNLGGAYYYDGDLVQAREAFRQTIAYYERSGHRRRLATMLNNLGDVCRVLGQYEEAYTLHQKALQIAQSLGDKWNEQMVLEGMARYYWDMGDTATARRLVEQSLAIVTGLDIIIAVAHHYNLLGLVLLEEGEWKQAEQAFTEAIHLSSAGGHHQVLMESYAGMARVAQAHGQKQRAMGWVDAIAKFVLEGNRLGSYTDAPFIYWACYELLKQTHDPRALLLLQCAYRDFETLAATLPFRREVTWFWRVPLRARLREEAMQRLTPAHTGIYPMSTG